MNISILTKDFKSIEMTATDVGMMPSVIHLWNAVLNEEHYRKTNYDVFREFCENAIYKKPEEDSVAISTQDYYLSVPREEIDCIFVHDARCKCGLKSGEI